MLISLSRHIQRNWLPTVCAVALANLGGSLESLASEHGHGGGSGGGTGPGIQYVPQVRTETVPVQTEHAVRAVDEVIYTVGPRVSIDMQPPIIIPDNFVRISDRGELSEGILVAGAIEQKIEYPAGGTPPEGLSLEGVSVQAKVLTTKEDRESAIVSEAIAPARLIVERAPSPTNPQTMVETRRYFLSIADPFFIPYTSLGAVIYSAAGNLVRTVIVRVCLVDRAGNLILGPNGPICTDQRITIGSVFLPPRLQPGLPIPVFDPRVLIPSLPIPFPGNFFPGGYLQPPRVTSTGGFGGNTNRGTRTQGPPRTMTGGGNIGGRGPGGMGTQPGGGWQAGVGTSTYPGGGNPIPEGTGQDQVAQGGAGAGQAEGGGQGAGVGQQQGPRRVSGGGQSTASQTGAEASQGDAAAGVIGEETAVVEVRSKQQAVFWFAPPEKEGSRHEVEVRLKNTSLGIALANLSVISKDQMEKYKKDRALINDLPNVSIALERGLSETVKTIELTEFVSTIPPEQLMYILTIAAPTTDDHLVQVAIRPIWAKDPLLKEKTYVGLPKEVKIVDASASQAEASTERLQ